LILEYNYIIYLLSTVASNISDVKVMSSTVAIIFVVS